MSVKKSIKDATSAYSLMVPALILYVTFILVPLIFGFYITLHEWDGFTDMKFIGLANYINIFKNPVIYEVLSHNTVYALGTVISKNIIAIFLALLLNRQFKGVTFFRTVYFIPVVMSFVAIGILWSWLYNPTFGLINVILLKTGIIKESIAFLGDPSIALWSLILVDIWRWSGYHTVIVLAGLQTVPKDLYESAGLDGATGFQRLVYITLPQIRPMIITNVTISLMGAFSVFDLMYIMTKGGPYNSTRVISTYMYDITFGSESRFGYGSSVAYILLFIIIIISIAQSKFMAKSDE